MTQYTVCPHCKAQNREDRTLCWECGKMFNEDVKTTDGVTASQVSHDQAVVVAQSSRRVPRRSNTQEIDMGEVLEAYKTLEMSCPRCGHTAELPVPVRLTNLKCKCGAELDPVQWDHTGPVNHLLMRRLLAICYKYPDFASQIIEQYKRDYDHAKIEEFGIDKALLCVHAANALVQRGHRSWVPFACLLLAFSFPLGFWIPPIGALFVLLYASQDDKNRKFRNQYLTPQNYDPTNVPIENWEEIRKLLHFLEDTRPSNLLFFSGYDPFSYRGENDDAWSFLVDRRKRTGGEVAVEPVPLDLDKTYDNIVDLVCHVEGPGASPTRFRVDDVVLVNGGKVAATDAPFIKGGLYPQTQVDTPVLTAIRDADDDKYRVYKRFTFYNPLRDIGMISFIRLQHQGPFTYIESVGTRLLPMTKKLFGKYQEHPSSEELEKEQAGPEWWQAMDRDKRNRFVFVSSWFLVTLALWFSMGIIAGAFVNPGSYPGFSGSGSETFPWLWLNVPHLTLLLLIAVSTYGFVPKLDDKYEPKEEIPFPISLVIPDQGGPRRRLLNKIKFMKEAQEFNYGPTKMSLRYSQSNAFPTTYFEDIDLKVLRRTQELAVQEAFLQCLEEAGIDTTEFREGAYKINNYGIINSGEISGDVKAVNKQAKAEKKAKQSGTSTVNAQGGE
jgi:hypothetical protein